MWIVVAIAVTSMTTVTIIATVITTTNSPRVIVITTAAGCLGPLPIRHNDCYQLHKLGELIPPLDVPEIIGSSQ
jgi:hypothetical protein